MVKYHPRKIGGWSHPDIEKDYYSALGAEVTSSQEEIERLYKRLARRHHPDRGGDAEEMKAINEAYRVLSNATTRRAYDSWRAHDSPHIYDSRHQRNQETVRAVVRQFTLPEKRLPDTILGRLVGASFFLLAGLVFLFLVRIYYIRFMWPILLVAALAVMFGVWKVHAVLVFARTRFEPSHPIQRYLLIQELAFWSIAGIAAYGIYLVMSSI